MAGKPRKTTKSKSTRKPKAARVAKVVTPSAEKVSATDRTYAAVTARIIEALEAGTVPWHKPWVSARSIATGKEYRGINALVLATTDFKSPYWLTYKQAESLGGNVKRGERGTPVIFWKWWRKDDGKDDAEPSEIDPKSWRATPFYFTVFNLDQTEGIPADKIPALPNGKHEAKAEAEAILRAYEAAGGPATIIGGAQASYSPKEDVVRLPAPDTFENSDHYYGAAFHEHAHSTGHKSRLDRWSLEAGPGQFGSAGYSREELVAEITSAMLCAVAGIERQQENSAAYIAGWLSVLRNDKRLLIGAAQAAQRAADYMRGIELAAKETKGVTHAAAK